MTQSQKNPQYVTRRILHGISSSFNFRFKYLSSFAHEGGSTGFRSVVIFVSFLCSVVFFFSQDYGISVEIKRENFFFFLEEDDSEE